MELITNSTELTGYERRTQCNQQKFLLQVCQESIKSIELPQSRTENWVDLSLEGLLKLSICIDYLRVGTWFGIVENLVVDVWR